MRAAGDESVAFRETLWPVAELLRHAGAPGDERGFGVGGEGEVAHLLGVLAEIEELLAAGLRPPDVFVAVAHEVVVAEVVLVDAGVLAVEGVAPFSRGTTCAQERQHAAAGDGGWDLDAGGVQQGGHHVLEPHRGVDRGAALEAHRCRRLEEEGDTRRAFVGEGLAVVIVVAQHLAVV